MSSEPSDELPDQLRFEVRPYEAEGGCPWTGLVLLIGLASLGGLVSAWGASYVYGWGGCGCSLIGWAIFYGGAGLVAIGPAALGVYLGQVRAPSIAALVGLLAGLFATAAFASFRFQHHMNALAQDNPAEHARLLAAQFGLFDYLGTWGFWDYLAVGVYLFVVGPINAVLLYSAASSPYCSACNCWKQQRVLGELVMSKEELVRIVREGEIVRLTDASRPSGRACLRLSGSVCPKCGAGGTLDVKVERVQINDKNEEETSELLHVTYPGQALPVFEAIFQEPSE